MRNTKLVVSALAVIVAAIGIYNVIPSQNRNDSVDVSALVNAANAVVIAGKTSEYSGKAMVSSLSSSLLSSSTDVSKLDENTGKVSVSGAGMSEVINGCTTYLNNASEEEIVASVEALDVATKFVPKGSIIEGYTNLGVSDVTSYLNVRKGAGTEHGLVGKMPGGSACEILEESNGWYKIKSGSVTGYVSSEYILTGYDANVKAMDTMKTMLLVLGDVLNVREEPSTQCTVSTTVVAGEYLEIEEEENNGWYKVNINNLVGYVSAEYVKVINTLPVAVEIVEVQVAKPSNPAGTGAGSSKNTYKGPSFDASTLDQTVSQTAKNLIEYSMQFLGNPYVYGGNSLTNGTDCSGFAKLIFAQFGYSLPRSSSDYINVGTRIPYTSAKPGDILVYKYGNSIGHVAIYIGNGQIVHASTPSGGIRIGNAYFTTPYCAVRVIP